MLTTLTKIDKYNLLKESIISGKYIDLEKIDNQLDSETIKKIIDEVELSERTLDILVFYITKYSGKTLSYILNKVNDEEKIKILNIVKRNCSGSPKACCQVKKFIDNRTNKIEVSEEKSKEYYLATRDILEVIFKESVTYEPLNKQLELSPSQLIMVFWWYKDDMKALKKLIDEAIISPVEYHIPSPDYLRDIAVAYGTIYIDYKNVDLVDFVHYFTNRFYEKKAIQCCRQKDVNVLDYEFTYEDEFVKIYYIRELNGLYIEYKEADIYSKKFYLYPVEDYEGNKTIIRRNDISPFDLYEEYKKNEDQIKRIDWPPINSDNFNDLSGNPSLTTKEEKYKRTKEIINSSETLKLLIETDEKTLKKI